MYNSLYNSEYKDYAIVLTDHAKQRCKEIKKTSYFIKCKIEQATIVKRSWAHLSWEVRRHGKNAIVLRNGHYNFVCRAIKESPEHKWQDVLLVITVINLNLRRVYATRNV